MDYKDWIQNKAEDLALEKQGKEFYELPRELRDTIYNMACEEYKDYLANEIDRIYEQLRELGYKGVKAK